MIYHTDFFEKSKSHRKDLDKRLDIISKHIIGGDSLLDIGTSGGYYSFGLQDKFKYITAIDNEEKCINECIEIQNKNNTDINFKHLSIDKILDNPYLRFWDCVLYMSVHHHVIDDYGWEKANRILKRLSLYCKTMFFDMGQKDENCSMHRWWRDLPDINDQEKWLRTYIKENTFFSKIVKIGSSSIHNTERILWKLIK